MSSSGRMQERKITLVVLNSMVLSMRGRGRERIYGEKGRYPIKDGRFKKISRSKWNRFIADIV
jgi:hypothetical protein